jgi:uncharacterized protein YgbK (DUF1537 family)
MDAAWLIIADDLTGAADCGIAFAKRGLESVVAWDKHKETGQVSVLSVDCASRRLSAEEAARRQVDVLASHYRSGLRLYKKIDSTLRGQPAAELAALLNFPAGMVAGRPRLAIFTPAFPGTGRVTIDGRVIVAGTPLEQTPLWARDHTYASASLPEILASAGLSADVLPLAVSAKGAEAVTAFLRGVRQRGTAAVACDAKSEADLAAIAAGSLPFADEAIWVGSAGLAYALAAVSVPPSAQPIKLPGRSKGKSILMVVGTLAEASRLQAKTVVEAGLVQHIVIAPATLFAGPAGAVWRQACSQLGEKLAAGVDVLVEIRQEAHPDLSRGAELAERLAEWVSSAGQSFGALVATGGDTVYALLSKMGVHGIRLLDEIEAGVPLGITLGAVSIPLVTKAGAFGDGLSLRRSLERLKKL